MKESEYIVIFQYSLITYIQTLAGLITPPRYMNSPWLERTAWPIQYAKKYKLIDFYFSNTPRILASIA